MKWLNYHHLIYFRVIAHKKSITKAAEVLNIGQPALSSQLKTFEESLGHKLFIRHRGQLEITEVGKAVLDYANQIHDLGQDLLHVVSAEKHNKLRHVSFGALSSIPKSLVSKLLETAKSSPSLQVQLLEGTGDELISSLISGDLSLVVTNYSVSQFSDRKLFCRPIEKFPVSVYGHKKYANYKKKFPASLPEAPMIMPTKHSRLRVDLDLYFNQFNLNIIPFAEVQDTSVQKLLAIEGQGLICLPDFAAKEYVKDGKLVKIGKLKNVFEEYWIVVAQRKIKNEVVSEIFNNFSI